MLRTLMLRTLTLNFPATAARGAARQLAVAAALVLATAGCGRPKPAQSADEPGADAIPGLVDVELRGVSAAHRALAAGLGTIVEDEAVDEGLFERDELLELEVDPAREAQVLARLRADPDVIFAEPVVRLQALWTPDDPSFPKQWHLKAAGAEAAWDAARGQGVTVAVIDTGIYPVDDLDEARLVPGHNFIARSSDARDDHGHGTHVAGTIGQSTGNGKGAAGMAPLSRLMPVKVLSAFGGGSSVGIADGIRWAVDHGARVLNLSLGGGGRSHDLESAVAYARRRGAVVVCAAGNSGGRGVSFPAAYAGAFAVSAVGPTAQLAPYSSYGPEVALAAPGGDKSGGEEGGVLQQTLAEGSTTASAYRWFQGTSMATPHVAGAAALLESLGVSDPGTVERVLRETARAPAARDPERYGAGLLDAGAAVRRVTLGWGLWRLGLAALGAFVALGHARRLQQLPARGGPGKSFWLGLVLGSGALTMLAPLGLARLPLAGALALPPVSMAVRWLGLPGTSAAATVAAFAGASALVPLGLALVARAAGSVRSSAFAALAAGFAFGWAGMLLQAALWRSVALPYLPSLLTPAFAAAGAVLSWAAGRGLFARETLR